MIQKKIKKLFIICIIALLFSGCSPFKKGIYYDSMNKNYKHTPGKKMAVISGGSHDGDQILAETITEKLSKSGKFKMMNQTDIAKILPKYPLNFHAIDFKITEKNDEDSITYTSESSKSRFKDIQRALKVDYLFVVWSEGLAVKTVFSSQTGSSTTMYASALGRMMEYPSGDLVGYSGLWKIYTLGFIDNFRSKESIVIEMYNETADRIVSEILKKTDGKN